MNAVERADPFTRFRTSAFRLEVRQTYSVPAEEPRLSAFRSGTARPERSVRSSPWLARIASDVIAGKDWSRVRLVTRPLTEYTRYQLLGYVESQAAGERIMLAEADAVPYPGTDFWLFDADGENPVAMLLHFDEAGSVRDRELVTGQDELAALAEWRDRASAAAVPLNEFLAREAMQERV